MYRNNGGLFLGEVLLRIFSFVKISNRNNEISHLRKDYFTILCIGDSVTYGVGGIEEEGYPKKLEEILTKKGYKIKVINKAYPGASTAGVLRQLKNSLWEYKVDLVITLTGCGNSLWNLNEMYEDLIKLRCNRCKELFSDNIHLNFWEYYLMAKKIADVIEEAFLKNKYIYKGLKNDKVHNKI